MLSSVLLIGRLGKLVSPTVREVLVERPLYEKEKETKVIDRYLTVYWSKNPYATMYKAKDGYLVAIKGRLTVCSELGVLIICEAIDYLDDYVKE
ncbi:MAG: hypothetical protein ACOX26_00475 [Bacilli bacterium]|jgi:hypothetical protein|nr:hypothetical protein [Bacilli bacterium]